MFDNALKAAKKAIENGMTYREYVEAISNSDMIEYVDIIIIDNDAFDRLQVILSKNYLK